METEKDLDRKLAADIKQLGGWCIKLVCTHIAGLPDRLCLMPNGQMFFAEIKTTGAKPRLIQTVIHVKLRKLGFKVYVIDNSNLIKEILSNYEN